MDGSIDYQQIKMSAQMLVGPPSKSKVALGLLEGSMMALNDPFYTNRDGLPPLELPSSSHTPPPIGRKGNGEASEGRHE